MGDLNVTKKKRDEETKTEQLETKTGQPEDDDYDPYEHRTGPGLTKNWEAWVNLVKSSVGAGLLGMPRAFVNSGYVLGLLSTVAIGIFCVYTLQILLPITAHVFWDDFKKLLQENSTVKLPEVLKNGSADSVSTSA